MSIGQGVYQHGGGAPPLEHTASDVLGRMRGAMGPPPRYPVPLTPEERGEAQQATDDHICRLCLGIHKYPGSPGCPRVATFKLDPDGRLIEGSFFPGTAWAQGRVILVEDIHEDEEVDEGVGD